MSQKQLIAYAGNEFFIVVGHLWVLARLHSAAFLGLDALSVDVEVDAIPSENPAGIIVGLPDTAVRESRDRTLSALRNSKYTIPNLRMTVNLAPGDLRKEGSFYDLPIAIGLLRCLGILKGATIEQDYLIVGELGLGGEVRHVCGALSIAVLAREMGKKGVILPFVNAREAAAVPGINVIAVKTLQEAVELIENPQAMKPVSIAITADLFRSATPLNRFCGCERSNSCEARC